MKCPNCEETLEFYDCFDEDFFDADWRYEYWFVSCPNCGKEFQVRESWKRTDTEIIKEIKEG